MLLVAGTHTVRRLPYPKPTHAHPLPIPPHTIPPSPTPFVDAHGWNEVLPAAMALNKTTSVSAANKATIFQILIQPTSSRGYILAAYLATDTADFLSADTADAFCFHCFPV